MVREKKKDVNPESGVVVVGQALAPQLASDNTYLTRSMIDQRKLAVLNPYTQAAMAYFALRGDPKGDNVRFFHHMVEFELNSSPSLGGLGRRQIIQAITAAAGGGGQGLDVASRPNIIARNVYNRDWKKKALEKGEIPTE
jgi:hypothetical protein